MSYETANWNSSRPSHVRVRSIFDDVLAHVETEGIAPGGKFNPAVRALAELYSAVVADKALSAEFARHRAAEELARRQFAEKQRAERLSALDSAKEVAPDVA